MSRPIPVIGLGVVPLMFGFADGPQGPKTGQTIRVSLHNDKPVLWMGSGVPAYITDRETLDNLIRGLMKARQEI